MEYCNKCNKPIFKFEPEFNYTGSFCEGHPMTTEEILHKIGNNKPSKVDPFQLVFQKLREDLELFYAYQANIAMAFKDEYHNFKKKSKSKYLNNQDIHAIANNAAINFLNQLIK